MRFLVASSALALILSAGTASAGCLTGAAVGAGAGHLAGHHAVLGAAAGCAIGHHHKKVSQQREAARYQQTSPGNGTHGNLGAAPGSNGESR